MLVADLQVAVDIPQLYVVTYDLKTVPTFILKAWGFECEHIRIGIFQYIWCNNCFYKSICRVTQLHRDQIGCEVSSIIQMEKIFIVMGFVEFIARVIRCVCMSLNRSRNVDSSW